MKNYIIIMLGNMVSRLRFIKVVIGILLITIIFTISCPDFFGLKPKEKELLPPPDPPSLIEPEDSSLFYTFDDIDFIWHAVDGAEYYYVRFRRLKWGTTFIRQAQSTTALDQRLMENFYMWSVRAYSSDWEDYTDWSDERFLHVAHP